MSDNHFFVGTDIVEVDRIHQLNKTHGNRFHKHVFTPSEVNWCSKRQVPQMHLAGKFAAKEAVKKAILASGEPNPIPMNSIEINRSEGRPPLVNITCNLTYSYEINVSISHTDTLATAVALVRKK